MTPQIYSFVGGNVGRWQVTCMETVIGTPLETITQLDILAGNLTAPRNAAWVLRGATSYERYVNHVEHAALVAVQPPLERPQATCAAMIPIKKSAAWWALSQDERRAIFEEESHHIQAGMGYLPAVARRLHHSHDLDEPFDFITWFEYAPEDAEAFETMTRAMRETEEWHYVEREIDIRLRRT